MIKRILYSLNNLTRNYRKTSLDSLTIGYDDKEFITKATSILDTNGILVITNAFKKEVIDRAYEEVDELIIKKQDSIFRNESFFEDTTLAFQKNLVKLPTYKEINEYYLPVVNMRSDDLTEPDGGMVDVFNVDKMEGFEKLTGLNTIYNLIRTDSAFKEIISKFVNSVSKSSTHIYINQGVINPRPIHFDNLDKTYKVFIYLTDVNELKYGPYSYVPGSHTTGGFIRRVHKLNKYFKKFTGDMPYFNSKRAIPILGAKGTIIISCQNGLHGGIPQDPEKMRLLYVDTFL